MGKRLVQKGEPRPSEIKKLKIPHARGPGIIDGNTGAPPALHTGQWANQQPVWENATPPCNFICPAGNDVQGFLAALTMKMWTAHSRCCCSLRRCRRSAAAYARASA